MEDDKDETRKVDPELLDELLDEEGMIAPLRTVLVGMLVFSHLNVGPNIMVNEDLDSIQKITDCLSSKTSAH